MALEGFLCGKDVFTVSPAGFGKTLVKHGGGSQLATGH